MTSKHRAPCGTSYGRLIGEISSQVLGCLIQLPRALSRQKDQTEQYPESTLCEMLPSMERIPYFHGHGYMYELSVRTYPEIKVLHAPFTMGGLSETCLPAISNAELPQPAFSPSPSPGCLLVRRNLQSRTTLPDTHGGSPQNQSVRQTTVAYYHDRLIDRGICHKKS